MAGGQSTLVTGGAGFIGTLTVLQLLKDGFKLVIINNLDNSAVAFHPAGAHRGESLHEPQVHSGVGLMSFCFFGGCVACNLGTGCGSLVLEMATAFDKASGKKIPIKLCPRRPGDATAVYASTAKAQK